MARISRVDQVVDFLLNAIASGEFELNSRLPAEEDLAKLASTSRLTLREAVRTLTAQQILRPIQGRGTFVNPPDQWISLEALMRLQRGNPTKTLLQLVDIRSFIEIGAAGAFAAMITGAQRAQLEAHIGELSEAHRNDDHVAAMKADLAFHQLIMDGCENPFLTAMMRPISQALVDARLATSSVPQMREHAIAEHTNILNALAAHDSDAARAAMRSHMRQTADDTRTYFD